MDQAEPAFSIDDVFAGSSFTVRGIYERLVDALRPIGPIAEEPREGGVALASGRDMFAECAPRGDRLLLDIRSADVIANGRIRRIGMGADGLFRNELLLASVNDVDEELLGWLHHARDTVAGR